MNEISDEQMAQILGVLPYEIAQRENIYIIKNTRKFEKVRIINNSHDKFVFVKYGNDNGIATEMMLYQKFLNSEIDKTPKVLGCISLSENVHALALEWIEDEHPDFTDRELVKKVFKELGIWAARWSLKQSELYENYFLDRMEDSSDKKQSIKAFIVNNKINESHIEKFFTSLLENVRANKEILRKYSEICIDEMFFKIGSELKDVIIKNIFRMSITLDPGDISLHNVFIVTKDNSLKFIDFESAKFKPLVLMLEYLGEDYGSMPNGELINCALEFFLDGWNSCSDINITWKEFMKSYCCARIYYKCRDFSNWIYWINKGQHMDEVKCWIKQGTNDLLKLVDNFYKCSDLKQN